jgi:predicted regulator of Ras-like GTPase activity (Roadblock/LC7/MglB family)
MELDGCMGAMVVDASSGMVLGQAGGGLNLDIAAAGNTEVVKAKLKTMQALGLRDSIEDILITLTSQYHIIRPRAANPTIFMYVVLDKKRANLAMARFKLAEVEAQILI